MVGAGQVIVIRHGEKPDSGNGLNSQGFARAQALVDFLLNNPAVTKFGTPAAIYAMKPKRTAPRPPQGRQTRQRTARR